MDMEITQLLTVAAVVFGIALMAVLAVVPLVIEGEARRSTRSPRGAAPAVRRLTPTTAPQPARRHLARAA